MAAGFRHAPAQAWAQFKRNTQFFRSTAITLQQWHSHYNNLFTQPHGMVVHNWQPFTRSIHPVRQHEANHDLSRPFTIDELIQTVHQINKQAAQGSDAVPTQVLALFYEDEDDGKTFPVLERLVPLFNRVLQGQPHPRSWDLSVISPLHKGKGDTDQPSTYRPLSISTAIYRFYMAVLTRRLNAVLEKFGLLPDTQYGFRENRGACHANLVLQEATLFGGCPPSPTHAAFLDLTQAYDSVHHDTLFSIMTHMGLPTHFISHIRSIYHHACFCVRTPHGYTPITPYTRGLRQGCPMSPVLFNIYFSVCDLWLKHHVHDCGKYLGLDELLQQICYADDATLLSDTRQQLQRLVTSFQACCDKLYLTINISPGKSGVVTFNHHGRARAIITTNGDIQNCTQYTHLGVVFHKDGSWQKAYKLRYDKATSCFDALKHDLRVHRLGDIWAASMIFNAKVMSTMLYGVQIWGWDKFQNFDWLQNEWQSLHVRTLKCAMHLPASTPDIPLTIESGMWPMMHYAIARTLRFVEDLHLAKSKWLDHLVSLDLPNGLMSRMRPILHRLSVQEGDQGPAIDKLTQHFCDLLHILCDDPRSEDVQSRKVASYLAWVWNEGLHQRPKFYDMHLSPADFRLALMARLMMVNVPMFSHAPFQNRKCPLCQSQFGDLQHILLECPHFQETRLSAFQTMDIQNPSMSNLFTSREQQVHEFIARMISLYKTATGR